MRSKALWKYLSDAGVLDGSEEEIQTAKKAYRRMYKREWKRKQQIPKKEIRPLFTLREYADIMRKAKDKDKSPTAYGKQLILASLDIHSPIQDRAVLLEILSHISMSVIALSRGDTSNLQFHLEAAERMLLSCVRNEQ
jgi:hypothetical protein